MDLNINITILVNSEKVDIPIKIPEKDLIKYLKPIKKVRFGVPPKPVQMFNLKGELIREFSSASEANKLYGYRQSMISNCCHGLRTHYKGFIWKFKR